MLPFYVPHDLLVFMPTLGQESIAHACEKSIFCLFYCQALNALLADDNKFGFIVMDGNGALFGVLCGNTREVLHKFTVDLPKKHG